ncbi:hypothetical protein HRG_002025 [Hirsutella rhossiliensis]|uniref:rRNA-processing protein FYV7 n=1 Tax=Hirsutella rhossiliensis TaxID=111463 RepID=A0A9P8SL57_9HYPO|nr:uncharacterized protein HRG_02025 [Hirsutella rhossiliensis]KAH0966616.1 hypothetical protein HRG_02025 [Hirsutella rhossiliensis]
MALKRKLDGPEPDPDKKPKRGFRVGPDNLPDGPWRRKVTKIKKDLIHKAKVKKAYAKIKARDQPASASSTVAPAAHDQSPESDHVESGAGDAEPEQPMHPTRELMLKDEQNAQAGANAPQTDASDGKRRRTRRPGYYDKQLEKAEERRQQAETRAQELRQRRDDRERKLAERERFKKAMAKTRGRDGKKKLGRESTLLLDKVKKIVAEGK